MEDALAEWEESISSWKVMWVKLRFVARITKVEGGGADQPATAPESKAQDSKKAKTESEGRSQ